MSYISENLQKKRLQKYNININTKYIVGSKILERNTNDTNNDDIINGIRCEKNYYIGPNKVHTEKIFDSRIEYTYISKNEENTSYKCPNCGMTSKLKDFLDGCPYCHTYYNIEYQDKDLGSKYHYDLVLKNSKYRIITAIVDLIISIILSYFFIIFTSRTFNIYDLSKVFIYGIILSLMLYYFFYILDAYIVLGPIKKYKEKQNSLQKQFWERTKISKKSFYNNLNYEIRKKYYSNENIIDYDILDFTSFEEYYEDKQLFVTVTAEVRLVYYQNNKITSKYLKDTYTMEKINDDPAKLEKGANIIKCHNCGASIDVTKGKCDYCGTAIKYFQEWIMK